MFFSRSGLPGPRLRGFWYPSGIAVLAAGTRGFSLEAPALGDLFILGAVFSAALYIIAARDLGQRLSPVAAASMQTFYGRFFSRRPFSMTCPDWTRPCF
jgi:drug/metabolite transporter (DMT)-like permease